MSGTCTGGMAIASTTIQTTSRSSVEGDEGWLLGAGGSFAYLAPDGNHRTAAEVAPGGNRMNDGACDPQGRFWGGTLRRCSVCS